MNSSSSSVWQRIREIQREFTSERDGKYTDFEVFRHGRRTLNGEGYFAYVLCRVAEVVQEDRERKAQDGYPEERM